MLSEMVPCSGTALLAQLALCWRFTICGKPGHCLRLHAGRKELTTGHGGQERREKEEPRKTRNTRKVMKSEACRQREQRPRRTKRTPASVGSEDSVRHRRALNLLCSVSGLGNWINATRALPFQMPRPAPRRQAGRVGQLRRHAAGPGKRIHFSGSQPRRIRRAIRPRSRRQSDRER